MWPDARGSSAWTGAIVFALGSLAIIIAVAAWDGAPMAWLPAQPASSAQSALLSEDLGNDAAEPARGLGSIAGDPFVLSPAVMAFAMLEAHNAFRHDAGVPPLAHNPSLSAIATQRAEEMAATACFSHYGPAGGTCPRSGPNRFAALLDRFGYTYAMAGENLARNNRPDAESVDIAMRGFLASPSHRHNLLHHRYTQVGIGVAMDGSMKYFAVILSD